MLTDASFGLEIEPVEKAIIARSSSDWQRASLGREQHWIGLPSEILLTPYEEILAMLRQLAPAPGSRLVDLGSGYGRLGLVIGRLFPEISFMGYECVPERVEEARRCFELNGFSPRVKTELRDLSAADFSPIPADSYFLYDFGSREAIEKTLEDLRRIAALRAISVVGRGRASRDAIERHHPWLSQVVPPRHLGNYSIYRSA